MVNKGGKEILEDKKERFLVAVKDSSKELDVKVPNVKFWEVYDTNHFAEGERAHIHVEQNLICISDRELERMSYEDITNTASHEVSHILHQNHGKEFQEVHNDTKVGLWRPPAGSVGALPEDYKPSKSKNKNEKPDKTHCNYHLCRKKAKTEQCKYCDKYFCSQHKSPSPASLPLFKSRDPKSNLIMDEYHREDTHPCMGYNTHWIKKAEKEEKEYGLALERLLKRKSDESYKDYQNNGNYKYSKEEDKEYNDYLKKNLEKSLIEEKEKSYSNNKTKEIEHKIVKKKSSNLFRNIIISIVILGILGFTYYLINPNSKDNLTSSCENLLKDSVKNGVFGENVKTVNIAKSQYAKNFNEASNLILNSKHYNDIEILKYRLQIAKYPIVIIDKSTYGNNTYEEGTTICDKDGLLKLNGKYIKF